MLFDNLESDRINGLVAFKYRASYRASMVGTFFQRYYSLTSGANRIGNGENC